MRNRSQNTRHCSLLTTGWSDPCWPLSTTTIKPPGSFNALFIFTANVVVLMRHWKCLIKRWADKFVMKVTVYVALLLYRVEMAYVIVSARVIGSNWEDTITSGFAADHFRHLFSVGNGEFWPINLTFGFLCIFQGEPEQQGEPDDQWESFYLFLAHTHETRLHHHGCPDGHPHLPDNHWELHPPVHVLLLQSATGRRPPWLPHVYTVLWGRNLSLLLYGWRLLILTNSVPSSLRPPRHASCHSSLRPTHPPPPPPSASISTPLPPCYSTVPDPSPAATLPAPTSPSYGTTNTVNQGSREREGKKTKMMMGFWEI